MRFKIITPAMPADLISSAAIKDHLRLAYADTTQDAAITAYMAAAQTFAQHYTERAIGEQDVEASADSFPPAALDLPLSPAVSVTSVKYLDTLGVEQTLSPSAYTLDTYGGRHAVRLVFGASWPNTITFPNAVKVRYLAGFDEVDPAVRSALLLLIGHLFQNREAVSEIKLEQVPFAVKALLDTYRTWSA